MGCMDAAADIVLLDATLKPNPPMSKVALRLVIGAVAAVNLGFGLIFVLRGAWPVTPFMGADVMFLAWALNAMHIAAQAFERVRLTPALLSVLRHSARGRDTEVTLNPYWARVDVDDPRNRLLIWSHGRAVHIGKFLPSAERLSFAKALNAALRRARESRAV